MKNLCEETFYVPTKFLAQVTQKLLIFFESLVLVHMVVNCVLE